MKSKITALFLLLSLFIPQTAFAVDEYIYEDVKAVYGWRMQNSGYEIDSGDSVSIVNDSEKGRALMVDKKSASHLNSWKGIIQDVPQAMLLEGHTYVLEYDFKMSNTGARIRAGFNVTRGYEQLTSKGNTDWNRRSAEYTHSGGAFDSGNLEIIFYNITSEGQFCIANAVLYDKENPDINLLVNGDFEDFDIVLEPEYADGTVSWTVPENMRGDGVNVYKREMDGTRVKLNDTVIPVSAGSAEVDIGNASCYLDIYTCMGDIEISWQEPAVCSAAVAVDSFDYKFYIGDTEIDGLEPGLITVACPIRNNFEEDGYNVEIIVLMKDGPYTKRAAKAAYRIMPSAEIEEYTVDINVDGADEDTRLEVYMWDSFDNMNVIRDMFTFPAEAWK